MAKFGLARFGLGFLALVVGFVAAILHIAFAKNDSVSAPGLPAGEHINGAIAGYGLSGIVLLLLCTLFDLVIQHFGWRKYIAYWWTFELFGFFLLMITNGALAVVYLKTGLARATLAFDIIFALIVLTILVLQCAEDPISQADKNYESSGIDSFLGCLVAQLEATGINAIVQLMLTFAIPVLAAVSFIISCVNARNGRSQQDGLGITGLLLVLASAALGVWRWLSYRNTAEWLFQWQLITLLSFYFLSMAVGAWMVPSNLAALDTAVLVLDTLLVLALLLRLLTTLEAPSEYESIGGGSSEQSKLTAPAPVAQPPPAVSTAPNGADARVVPGEV